MSKQRKLRSEMNTPEVRRELEERFRADYIFEHGHWWVTLGPSRSPFGQFLFSVVDTDNGFDLEQV